MYVHLLREVSVFKFSTKNILTFQKVASNRKISKMADINLTVTSEQTIYYPCICDVS